MRSEISIHSTYLALEVLNPTYHPIYALGGILEVDLAALRSF
jgi:hypothetical protein